MWVFGAKYWEPHMCSYLTARLRWDRPPFQPQSLRVAAGPCIGQLGSGNALSLPGPLSPSVGEGRGHWSVGGPGTHTGPGSVEPSFSLQPESQRRDFAEKLESLLHRAYHLQEEFGSTFPSDSALLDLGELAGDRLGTGRGGAGWRWEGARDLGWGSLTALRACGPRLISALLA